MSPVAAGVPASQAGLELTLFVAGDSPASHRARARLAELLESLELPLTPRVVDVLLAPQEAMQHRIFVTPALIVRHEGRLDTIIGDLSHTADVVSLLRPGH